MLTNQVGRFYHTAFQNGGQNALDGAWEKIGVANLLGAKKSPSVPVTINDKICSRFTRWRFTLNFSFKYL